MECYVKNVLFVLLVKQPRCKWCGREMNNMYFPNMLSVGNYFLASKIDVLCRN